MRIKQSTAVAISFGPFLDPTDGVTLVTGAVSAIDNGTTGIKLSKNGGALTIRHATVTASTYDAYGNYIVTLDTTDTNTLGTLRMQFAAAATCLPVWMDFEVVNANEWDSSFGTSVLKKVDVTQLLTTAWLTPGTAGTPDVNVKLWNALATVALPLVPTVAGRTLDVSATGEGGVDWANVGSPTTTLALTGTTVGTITTYTGNTVQTGDSFARIGVAGAGLTNIDLPNQTMDITGNITGNLSGSVGSVTGAAGSVTGAVGSVTGNVGGNVVGSVGSVVGAVGSVTGNVGGNVTGSVGSIATGGIAAASFAAGAIDNAAIAANAIGASELATDAVTEIANGLLDLADAVEVGITVRQSLRGYAAALLGKASGMATTTGVMRAADDSKTRITATLDASGNRSAVTLDLT